MMRLRLLLAALLILSVQGACNRGFDDSDNAPPEVPPPELSQGAPPMPHVPSSTPAPATPARRAPRGTPEGSGAGGLAWVVPPGFETEAPSSGMRAAQYRFPGENGEPEATLAVFYFGSNMGGGVQENIDRWVGQIAQPDGRPSREATRTAHRTIAGMPVTTVDVSGDFAGGMPGMPGAGTTPAATNQRLIGAIVEGPEGLVFFKMVGPAGTMERARPAFTALVASLHPSGAPQ